MKRTILAATAAALLASVTLGIAAPNDQAGRPGGPTPAQMADNAAAMSDARIAALKAGLKLTPDQEKLWPALETALNDYSAKRITTYKAWMEKRQAMRAEARAARAAQPDAAAAQPGTPAPQADATPAPAPQADADAAPAARPNRDFVARLEQRADRMVERGTALKQLTAAAAPLYASLDDAQKRRFAVLFRVAEGPRSAQGRGWHHGPQRGQPWQRGEDGNSGRMHHGPGMMPPAGDSQRL